MSTVYCYWRPKIILLFFHPLQSRKATSFMFLFCFSICNIRNFSWRLILFFLNPSWPRDMANSHSSYKLMLHAGQKMSKNLLLHSWHSPFHKLIAEAATQGANLPTGTSLGLAPGHFRLPSVEGIELPTSHSAICNLLSKFPAFISSYFFDGRQKTLLSFQRKCTVNVQLLPLSKTKTRRNKCFVWIYNTWERKCIISHFSTPSAT